MELALMIATAGALTGGLWIPLAVHVWRDRKEEEDTHTCLFPPS